MLWSISGGGPSSLSRLARLLPGPTWPAAAPFPPDVDTWLKLGPDGTVTLFTGKVEFGQGIQTAFGQLVAEELDLPFESVDVIMGSTDQVPYDTPTFGSMSMRLTGPIVRQASAEMRQWLLELGSTSWACRWASWAPPTEPSWF